MNMLVHIPVKYRQKKVGGKPTKSLMFTDQNQARELLQASCLDPTQLQHLLNFSFNVDIASRARAASPASSVFQSEAICFMCVLTQNGRRYLKPLMAGCIHHLTLYLNGHIYPLGLGRQCIPQSEWIERLANWTPRFDKHLVLCHIVHPSFQLMALVLRLDHMCTDPNWVSPNFELVHCGLLSKMTLHLCSPLNSWHITRKVIHFSDKLIWSRV